jgi:hypothetical protein
VSAGSLAMGQNSRRRGDMRCKLACAVVSAILGPLAFAAAASADTTLGITSQPSGSGPGTCNSTTTYGQTAQDPSTPYFVPSGGGMITQWQTVVATSDVAGMSLEFVVLSPAAGEYTVVGTDTETLPSPLPAVGSLVSFPLATPIQVQAEDTLGLASSSGAVCYFGVGSTPAGDEISGLVFSSSPPSAGETSTSNEPAEFASVVDVAATLAPSLPTVTGVSPPSGPAAGGTTVTITGTSFDGATGVSFGSTPAASFNVVSGTTLTAVAPPGTGTVDVTVQNAGQSAVSAADKYTYIPKPVVPSVPVVTSVSPSHGFRTGGQTVTISGSGFTGATAVSFGGTAATSFTVNSDSSITAKTPPDAVGTVDVAVAAAGGTSAATAADHFTFEQVCIVPKLKGEKLKAARKALRNAHCAIGKVKGPEGKTARVTKQTPKPGSVLSAGSKVNMRIKL